MSKISRKFEIELKKLRQQLENGDRIVYNNVDDIEPLDNAADELLYEFINTLAPKSVFEHNCGFGVNVINLHRFLDVHCYGSTYNDQFAKVFVDKFKNDNDGDVGVTGNIGSLSFSIVPVNYDVVLIDNDNFRMSEEDLMTDLKMISAFLEHMDHTIVVRDSQLTNLADFEKASLVSLEDEDEQDVEIPNVFFQHVKGNNEFILDNVSLKEDDDEYGETSEE